MMFPWKVVLEPPLKLLVDRKPAVVFAEMRLRSAGSGPPMVAPTVPPCVKPMAIPISLGEAERPVGSVPMKLPAMTMPVGLAPKKLKSSIPSVHRLMTRPRIVTSLEPIVMHRLGAVVPSISIWSTVFSAPVGLVFGELPGCV